ncbi:thiamine phosphate synthase [Jeotgalibacillus soli]|uniref:Transcriptional regulator n=1 Tax=Jeotgalibacillus soli TaxID=889306 RepID=A0A0C2VT19_9BACL|nr:thiamine phosphate synthase [Jeotgalibacillus soli]KIL52062.1 transcriptional regulator [Jeotgalibacillus soli]
MNRFTYHVLSTGGQPPAKWLETMGTVHKDVDYIHIREKNATAKELLNYIDSLLSLGVPAHKLIVNDRVDVAWTQTIGVQLAYHSLNAEMVKDFFPSLLVGASVHSVEEAHIATSAGADYLLYGHIFPTNSKPNQTPRGLSALEQVVEASTVPIIAIGGILPWHVPLIQQTGAAGIALMSGVMNAIDPLLAIQSYRKEEIHGQV